MAERFLGLTGRSWMWIGIAIFVIVIILVIIAVVTKEYFTTKGVTSQEYELQGGGGSQKSYETLGPYVPFSDSGEYSASSSEGGEVIEGGGGEMMTSEIPQSTSYSPSDGNTINHEPEVINLGVYEEGKGPSMTDLSGDGSSPQGGGWSPSNSSKIEEYSDSEVEESTTKIPQSFY